MVKLLQKTFHRIEMYKHDVIWLQGNAQKKVFYLSFIVKNEEELDYSGTKPKTAFPTLRLWKHRIHIFFSHFVSVQRLLEWPIEYHNYVVTGNF